MSLQQQQRMKNNTAIKVLFHLNHKKIEGQLYELTKATNRRSERIQLSNELIIRVGGVKKQGFTLFQR